MLRERLEVAGLIPPLELVDFMGVSVAGFRVRHDRGERGALVVVEVLHRFKVAVRSEKRADVGEGEAAILLEDAVSCEGIASELLYYRRDATAETLTKLFVADRNA